MYACILKSNGRLIEAQSDAVPGTLIANAISAGYLAAEVEEKVVSAAEFAALLLALRPSTDELAALHIDSVDRLQFAVMFDMENRMRARESQPTITQAQYRTALINRWKAIN